MADLTTMSMGGYVVMELWRRAPERIGAVVLTNTRAGADSPLARKARHAAAERVRLGELPEYARELAAALFAPGAVAPAVHAPLHNLGETGQGLLGACTRWKSCAPPTPRAWWPPWAPAEA